VAKRQEVDRISLEGISGVEVRWPVVRIRIVGILVRLCTAATGHPTMVCSAAFASSSTRTSTLLTLVGDDKAAADWQTHKGTQEHPRDCSLLSRAAAKFRYTGASVKAHRFNARDFQKKIAIMFNRQRRDEGVSDALPWFRSIRRSQQGAVSVARRDPRKGILSNYVRLIHLDSTSSAEVRPSYFACTSRTCIE
jgi:hypothetical protein